MYARYLGSSPGQRYADKSRSPYQPHQRVSSQHSEHSPGGTMTADERMAVEHLDSLAGDFQPSFVETMKNEVYPRHNYKVIAAFKVYKVDRNRESLIQNLIHLHTEIENRRSKVSSHSALHPQDLDRSVRSERQSSERPSPYRRNQSSPSFRQDTSLDIEAVRDQLGLAARNQEEIQRRMLAYVGRDGLTRETFKICFKICLPMPGSDTSRVPQYIKAIEDLFFLFDRNGDNIVDRKEMQKGLNMLFNRELEGSFLSGAGEDSRESPLRGREQEQIFNQMRQQGKDYLVLRDVELFISRLLPPPDQRKAISMALESFRVADTNRDGRISEDEFVDWYNSPDFRKIHSLMGNSPSRYKPSPSASSEPRQLSPSTVNKESLPSESSPGEAVAQISPGHGTIQEEPLEAEVSSTNSPSLTIESRKRGSGTARSHNFSPQKRQSITPGQVRDAVISVNQTDALPSVQEEESKESPPSTHQVTAPAQKQSVAFSGGNLMQDQLKLDQAGYGGRYDAESRPQTNRSVKSHVTEDDLERIMSSKNLTAMSRLNTQKGRHHRSIYLLQRESTLGPLSRGFIEKSFTRTMEKNPMFGEAMEDLEQLRLNSGLNSVNFLKMAREMKKLITMFEEGLELPEFIELVFKHYQNQDMTGGQKKLRKSSLVKVFQFMDEDKNGKVELIELAKGLTILCGGSMQDKIEGAFMLFDYNNSETLDFEELTSMLSVVYKVFFQNRKGFEKTANVEPGELADIVGQKCFNDLDIQPSGEVHLQPFLEWCFGRSFESNKLRELRQKKPKATKQHQKQAKRKLITDCMTGLLKRKEVYEKLDKLIESLRLNRINVSDAIKFFSERNINGYFNKTQFYAALRGLLTKYECFDEELEHHIDQSLSQFFGLFDSKNNGIIDLDEIALACTFLCRGTLGDKLKVLFEYFDEDLDDKISFPELVKYLKALFQLVLQTMNDPQLDFMDAGKLAEATARNCFGAVNLDEGDALSLNDFRKWCLMGKKSDKKKNKKH